MKETTLDPPAVAELSALRNLGPASARWLVAAGIRSRRDLERLGAAGLMGVVLTLAGDRG